jgi:hypothetical protein
MEITKRGQENKSDIKMKASRDPASFSTVILAQNVPERV